MSQMKLDVHYRVLVPKEEENKIMISD